MIKNARRSGAPQLTSAPHGDNYNTFAVSVGEKLIMKKKRRDSTLKVIDDGRGQLGHLQRELVPVLACFPILNLSILDHSRLIWVGSMAHALKSPS